MIDRTVQRAIYPVCVTLCLCGPTGWAQESARSAGAAGSVVLEEIVVTANRREETLQSVPASVSALTGEALAEQGAEQISDYFRSVPGLQVYSSGKPSSNTLVIRGISGEPNGTLVQGTVGVYLDEIPVTIGQNGGNNIDASLFDIERVTVLRGPQGTLYGAASLGGTLKTESAKPDLGRFATRVGTTLSHTQGGDLNYSVDGMINLPVVQDELALRLVGFRRDMDGFIDNVTLGRDNVNNETTSGGRMRTRWQASERLRLDASVLHQKVETDGSGRFEPAVGDLQQSSFAGEPSSNEFTASNLTISFDLGAAEMISSTSYLDWEVVSVADGTELFRPLVEFLHLTFFGTPRSLPGPGVSTITTSSEVLVQELRLVSKADANPTWSLGAFYSDEDTVEIGSSPYEGFAEAFGPLAGGSDDLFGVSNPATFKQYAAFGELGYRWDNGLRLLGGVRYSKSTFDLVNDVSGFLANPTQNGAVDEESSAVTPRLILSHESDGRLLYVQAARGFRAGAPNVPIITLAGVDTPQTFAPDTLWNYEIGAKTTWLDQRLIANIAAFFIDWQDMQSTITRADGFLYVDNLGSATSKGAELELQARPTLHWTLGLAAAYTNAVLEEDVPTVGEKGDPLPGVPEFSFSGSVQYEFSLAGGTGFVRGEYQSVDESKSESGPLAVDIGGYDVASLRFGYRADAWDCALFVNNLADERGYVSAATLPELAFATIRPRTYGLSLRWRY